MIDMCRKLLTCCLIISSSYLYLVRAAPHQKTRTGENAPTFSGQKIKQSHEQPFNLKEEDYEEHWYPLEYDDETADGVYEDAELGSRPKKANANANQGNSTKMHEKAKGSEKSDKSESMWKEKVHKIFIDWGFTDEQIPKPFGSSNTLKLNKSTPQDFEKTLKDILTTAPNTLKEKLKELLESNKENKGNTTNKSNLQSKTICDGKHAGKCATESSVSSTGKNKMVDGSKQFSHGQHSQGQQTLDELVKSMEEITREQNKLTEKEVDKIRQIIGKMTELIRELQEAARNCGNEHSAAGKASGQHSQKIANTLSKNSKTESTTNEHGSVAEIEEKHTVERKIFTKKEHDETLMHPNNATEHESDSDLPNFGEVASSELNYENDNVTRSLSTNEQTTINYLNVPVDVNYNGGINSPMDELKQKYPDGHWPDEAEGSDSDDTNGQVTIQQEQKSSVIGNDVHMHASNPHELERNEIDESYRNSNSFYDDESDYEDYTLDQVDVLSPEYLEEIIRLEHASQNKSTTRTHHVQQHELPTLNNK